MKYDFAEVMKEWRRMCDTCSAKGGSCPGCTLYPKGMCGAVWEIDMNSIDEIAPAIMQWSVANPPERYPTWYEYLEAIGANVASGATLVDWLVEHEIPADVAEKLELEKG